MNKYRNGYTKDRVGDVLGLLEYTSTKFIIRMIYDDGSGEDLIKPTEYRDLKFMDIAEYLDEEVYSISAYRSMVIISFCDPKGEWK